MANSLVQCGDVGIYLNRQAKFSSGHFPCQKLPVNFEDSEAVPGTAGDCSGNSRKYQQIIPTDLAIDYSWKYIRLTIP